MWISLYSKLKDFLIQHQTQKSFKELGNIVIHFTVNFKFNKLKTVVINIK